MPAPGDYIDTALLSYYIDTSTLTENVDRLMEGIFGIAEEDGEDLDSDPEPLDDASSSEDESPVSNDELWFFNSLFLVTCPYAKHYRIDL